MINTTPKPMRIKPLSLLMRCIKLTVNFFLSFPARNTLSKSAANTTARQVANNANLSSIVIAANAVAQVNQNAITPGLSVFIKYPAM